MSKLLLGFMVFAGIFLCGTSNSIAHEHEERKERREHNQDHEREKHREHDQDSEREEHREHDQDHEREEHREHDQDREEHREHDQDREHDKAYRGNRAREMQMLPQQFNKYVRKNFTDYAKDLAGMAEEKEERFRVHYGEICENINILIFMGRVRRMAEHEKKEITIDRTINVLNLLSEHFAMKAAQLENKKSAAVYIEKLDAVLEKIFNMRAESYSSRIKKQANEIKQLKKKLEKRMADKKEIVKLRREQLLRDFNKERSWDWGE